MTTVITYGTFDLLHWGHVKLLENAAKLGDKLIIGLSTDEFNEIKGKKAYHSYEHRRYMLKALKFVDEVISEDSWNQKVEDIRKYSVDVFVMGSDWSGQFDFLESCCSVMYLPRTQGISTTKIKKDLLN